MRTPLITRRGLLAVGTAGLATVLAACGQAAAHAGGATPKPAEGGRAGGEAAGGDEPTVVFRDPSGQFTFEHPRSWGQTTQPGETARFTGRDEFIAVRVVSTSATPLEFGRTDASALATASPGYKVTGALKAYKVAGKDGAMVAYTWQAGPSPVTGKLVPSSANRYYIPGPAGKLAVFTYSCPSQSYDPAGADDFANAFRWLA